MTTSIDFEDHESVINDMLKDPEFEREYSRTEVYASLADEVYQLRKELRLTQAQLADKSKTHQSRISKIESGEVDVTLGTVIDIADALGARVDIRFVRRLRFEPLTTEASAIAPTKVDMPNFVRVDVSGMNGASVARTSNAIAEYALA